MKGEWTRTTLGSVTEWKSGGTPSKRNDSYWNGSIPWISASSMKSTFLYDSDQRITEEGLANGSRLTPTDSILLLVRGSELHKRVPIGITTRSVAFNQDVKALRPNPSVLPRFLYYWLLSNETLLLGKVEHTGIGAGKLDTSVLQGMALDLPPLPTQRRIAHILGTLDDKIELNRRMNRTLEKMAAAIFKSWFIDFDPVWRNAARDRNQPSPPSPLPMGEGWPTGRGEGCVEAFDAMFPDTFEYSVLGQIPKGWKVGSLGDVADSPRRGVKPSDVPPATPYIGLEHMPRRCIALDAWGRAEDVASGKSQFKQGEIMFGKLRPYFHKVGIAPMDGVCSTDIVVVTPKSQDWHGYVLSLVSSKAFVDYTDSHSAGTKMPRTNWKDMNRYPLALPPLSVAKAFQIHVADFHRRIMLNVRQNRRLAGLRDALLPKLMCGEIEMPVAETGARRCK